MCVTGAGIKLNCLTQIFKEMKKIMMFLGFLLVPVMVFCQQDSTVIVPPTGWGDIISNPTLWISSFTGVSLVTAFLAAFFNGLLKWTKSFYKQLTAWVIAIIIVVVTDLLNIGYAKDYPLLFAVINGFFAGLAANGWFNIPTLKAILTAIEGWFVKK
jgi:hypothetical protein